MDIFLVKGGIVENVVAVPSMQWAEQAYPGYVLVERTDENKQVQIGESLA